MKKLTFILIAILAVSLLCLAACDGTGNHKGVKVVYELEGGVFQNGTGSVIHYYDFEKGTQNLIQPMQSFYASEQNGNDGLSHPSGYVLSGWYKTKNDNGTYSDEWNFATDKVGDEGVTLYAWWKKPVTYTFDIYDFDTDQLVRKQTVDEGATLRDTHATRSGYTLIKFYNENKQDWNSSTRHPGGDTESVKVYAKYVEGSFSVVRTAVALKAAINDNSKNIYIDADINMNNDTLSFGNFTREIRGNGHKIYNFSVYYESSKDSLVEDFNDASKKALNISLFGMANGAVIKDIEFEQVTIDVKTDFDQIKTIYVAPIAINSKNTTISNVSVKGTITVSKLPSSAEQSAEWFKDNCLHIQSTDAVYEPGDNTTITDYTSEISVSYNI